MTDNCEHTAAGACAFCYSALLQRVEALREAMYEARAALWALSGAWRLRVAGYSTDLGTPHGTEAMVYRRCAAELDAALAPSPPETPAPEGAAGTRPGWEERDAREEVSRYAKMMAAPSPVESPGEERTTGGSTLPGAMRPEFVHAREVAVALSRVAAGDDPAQVEEDYGFPGGMLAHAHPAPAAAESTRAELAEIERMVSEYGRAIVYGGNGLKALEARATLLSAIRSLRAPREVEEAPERGDGEGRS